METLKEYGIKFTTDGLEEAKGELEALADAYDGFPAQVTIKHCDNCTFNIYPSQTKLYEGVKDADEDKPEE